jgi:hypothetical protein
MNSTTTTTTTTLKDDSISLSKTFLPYTLQFLLPIALLPIVLLCIYFYPLSITKSQTQLHHATTSTPPPPYAGMWMHNFVF